MCGTCSDFSRTVDFNPTDIDRIFELQSKKITFSEETVWSRMNQRLENWNKGITYNPTPSQFEEDRDIMLITNETNNPIYDLNLLNEQFKTFKAPYYNYPTALRENRFILHCTNECRNVMCTGIHPPFNLETVKLEIDKLYKDVGENIW